MSLSLSEYQRLVFLKHFRQLSTLPDCAFPDSPALSSTINQRVRLYKKFPEKVPMHSYFNSLQVSSSNLGYIQLFDLSMKSYLSEAYSEECPDLNVLLGSVASREMEQDRLIEKEVESSLLFRCILMEVSIKGIISKREETGRYERGSQEDIEWLLRLVRGMVRKYEFGEAYGSKMIKILMNMRIQLLEESAQSPLETTLALLQYIEEISQDRKQYPSLVPKSVELTTLYHAVRLLLGSSPKQFDLFCLEHTDMQALLASVSGIPKAHSYDQHLLALFSALRSLLFSSNEDEKLSFNEEEDLYLSDKLSVFACINFDESLNSLDHMSKQIAQFRIASLATLISLKLNRPKLDLQFLESLHQSVFQDERRDTKLCVQLFEDGQYGKLNTFLRMTVAKCKHRGHCELLRCLCVIFMGIYLQNHQEALLFAELNLHESEKDSAVLRRETLFMHVGFSYYNLAVNSLYLHQRKLYLQHARIALQRSKSINPENCLASYVLTKIYILNGEHHRAYQLAIDCCKSGRGEWVTFSLLALVYCCQRKNSKAMLLIDELIKKHGNGGRGTVPLLYYMKAYLQTNRILLQIQNHEDVQAAREISDETEEATRKQILQAESVNGVLQACQWYFELGLGYGPSEPDASFFADPSRLAARVEGASQDSVEGQKILLQIVDLLMELEQTSLCRAILSALVPCSTSKTYYTALLHERNKEYPEAMKALQSILFYQPYHSRSLIALGRLEQDPVQSLHYLDIAAKLVDDSELCFVRGAVLNRVGRLKEAYQLLLTTSSAYQGWLEVQPDLIYYF